jgi:hypothetical protein
MTPRTAGRRPWPSLVLGLVVAALAVSACGGDDGPSLGGIPIQSPGEFCDLALPSDCSPVVNAAVAKSKTLHPEEPAPIRGVTYQRRSTDKVLPLGGPSFRVVELDFADGTSRVFAVTWAAGGANMPFDVAER